MDTADDIAYAIHDVEDFYRVGVLQQGSVATELLAWQRHRRPSCPVWPTRTLAARRAPARPVDRAAAPAAAPQGRLDQR